MRAPAALLLAILGAAGCTSPARVAARPDGAPPDTHIVVYGFPATLADCRTIAPGALAAGGFAVRTHGDAAAATAFVGTAPDALAEYACDPGGNFVFVDVVGYDRTRVDAASSAIGAEYQREANGAAPAPAAGASAPAGALVSSLATVRAKAASPAACRAVAKARLARAGFVPGAPAAPSGGTATWLTFGVVRSSLGQVYCDRDDGVVFVSVVGTSGDEVERLTRTLLGDDADGRIY